MYFSIQGAEAYENILTVSWRPTFAFSTACSRDTFRCLAWEVLNIEESHIRHIWQQKEGAEIFVLLAEAKFTFRPFNGYVGSLKIWTWLLTSALEVSG